MNSRSHKSLEGVRSQTVFENRGRALALKMDA